MLDTVLSTLILGTLEEGVFALAATEAKMAENRKKSKGERHSPANGLSVSETYPSKDSHVRKVWSLWCGG